jgi:rhodanese-related sulfurtransferase
MTILFAVLGLILCAVAALVLVRRRKANEEITRFSVTPADLRSLLDTPDSVLVVDVRLPLDLLADPHIIPGSIRLAPKEVQANPALVPRDRDVVFYCTCPSDGTSRETLHKAHAANHLRVKFLRGGLAAWKAQGFPVETYDTAFRLDTL